MVIMKENLFKVISKVLPLVEGVTFLNAVCRETGNDASFSMRLTNNKNKEFIGGAKEYSAVDRQTYFSKN